MPEGSIRVSITEQNGRVRASATGSITSGLTDAHRALGLTHAAVLRAVRKITGDDGYRSFSFTRMTQTLTPMPGTARLTSSEREPLVRSTRTYRNRSSKPASYDGRLSTTETDSVSLSWSNSRHIEAGFEIGYEAFISASARMTFGSTVGAGGEHSQSVVLAADDGVRVDLQPGQEALASLTVYRRSDTVQMKYRVEYNGAVVATYKDNSDTTFDLHEILEECGRNKHEVITETIRIKYFTDAEVVLSDL